MAAQRARFGRQLAHFFFLLSLVLVHQNQNTKKKTWARGSVVGQRGSAGGDVQLAFFLTNSIVFTIFGRCLCTPLRSVASPLLRREATVQLVGEHGDVHDLLQTLLRVALRACHEVPLADF